MRAALIDSTGRVVNIAEFESEFNAEEWAGLDAYLLDAEENVGVGWFRVDGAWVEPEPTPPPPPTESELEFSAILFSARMAVSDKIKSEELNEETVARLVPLFPELSLAGVDVTAGEIYRWDHGLVEVIQSHTTQPDWTPEATPALFKRYFAPEDGPQPWVQPAGAHDAYAADALVTHNGQTWKNTHGNGNVWEPGVFGWTVQ